MIVWNFLLKTIILYVTVWPWSVYSTNTELRNVSETQTFTDELRKVLLKNYSRLSLPNYDYNKTIVKFGVAINHVEVVEATDTVHFYTYLRMVWRDLKLKWDPDDYGGLKVLHVSYHEIWKPKIFLYNSPSRYQTTYYVESGLLVYPNGQVLQVPPKQCSVLCDLNLRYWPFDVQHCQLSFGPWSSNGEEIELEFYNNKQSADLSDFILSNHQWKITYAQAEMRNQKFPNFKDSYPGITYNITLERKSPVYRCLIVTPAIFIIVSTLTPFWITPRGYGRVFLNCMTLMLIFSLFFYFNKILSSLGNHTPLIMSFYTHCLYVLSLAIIENMLVIWMVETKHAEPVPWRIKKYFTGKLGSLAGFRPMAQQTPEILDQRIEEMNDHEVADAEYISGARQMISTSDKLLIKEEWNSFAKAIDKLVFIFYCFLLSIMAIAHSV